MKVSLLLILPINFLAKLNLNKITSIIQEESCTNSIIILHNQCQRVWKLLYYTIIFYRKIPDLSAHTAWDINICTRKLKLYHNSYEINNIAFQYISFWKPSSSLGDRFTKIK